MSGFQAVRCCAKCSLRVTGRILYEVMRSFVGPASSSARAQSCTHAGAIGLIILRFCPVSRLSQLPIGARNDRKSEAQSGRACCLSRSLPHGHIRTSVCLVRWPGANLVKAAHRLPACPNVATPPLPHPKVSGGVTVVCRRPGLIAWVSVGLGTASVLGSPCSGGVR